MVAQTQTDIKMKHSIGYNSVSYEGTPSLQIMHDAMMMASEQDVSNGGPGFPEEDLASFFTYINNNFPAEIKRFAEFRLDLRKIDEHKEKPFMVRFQEKVDLAKTFDIEY